MELFCKNFLLFVALISSIAAHAQFAPAVGLQGSTAIWKDDSQFVEWATGCVIQRGYMDIAQPDSGFASVGDSVSAIGNAGTNGVVSLGDGGIATLSFPNAIYNGPGFDFAVFENGFSTGDSIHAFLEFGFAEVSSDGNNFYRFPATSNIQDTVQLAMQGIDCSLVNNLAGKYVFGYGTPFDLNELKNEPGLDVNHITYIRIIDVVGSINSQYATHDQYGHKINDPYPTLFPSGGFDLDAVGVIHAIGTSGVKQFSDSRVPFQLYPNPACGEAVWLEVEDNIVGKEVDVFDATGKLMSRRNITSVNSKLFVSDFQPGIYFIKSGIYVDKLVVE